MSLDERFNEAAERVKTLTKRPTDQELLQLYAFFKQGSFGDNNTSKPGMLDLKGKAKWNAYWEKKGMSQDIAKEKYIAFVDELMEKYKE
ncbi:acyl-CoA-binding protein homolog [Sitodiplosis mosellana]|uniref:acyl-CoA-binding protein homolog n=1 Tax=Sitodiplosis mosellana TaxID=263140 RepID=UPI002443A4FA|nr:acyl-CoA-binding protein homolog [Sitodiplosis mosellana]XP_055300117.1 acyl-CoA-binding protein homolog [Sitodiplosis mosellana]XP_055300118.1 acyl-CoA-binding protein homolog [Sitodiplosis mosellana]XP_055300119.1 acyl-CoA-binding protein homolog [Sitodiplosis mosellana]